MTLRGVAIFCISLLVLSGCDRGGAVSTDTSGGGDTSDIRIVGSSTVYPFSTKVAQEFKNKTGYNVVVESTGSGGGHKLFCAGAGAETPDVTNSARRQKTSELTICEANGVDEIVEVKIGFDGIVLASAVEANTLELTLRDIYLALAKQVPVSDDDCTMRNNPYTYWSDIRSNLPKTVIAVYGPPPTSGTRDAFVEIAMESGASEIPCLAALQSRDKGMFTKFAQTLREDGKWIDAGESDNSIVHTLINTPTSLGVLGYSFLDQNTNRINAAKISGVAPTTETIARGQYAISRSLFFYLKSAKVRSKAGLKEYALEFTSEEAWGPDGYLQEIGLVPLPVAERTKYRRAVENLTPYKQ